MRKNICDSCRKHLAQILVEPNLDESCNDDVYRCRVEQYWYSILGTVLLLQYCGVTILWWSEQVPLKFFAVHHVYLELKV